MRVLLNWVTVISVIVMITLILLQTRGQSLGVSFGGDSNFYRTRRGAEKIIFNATIVVAVIFVMSVILGILAKS